MCCPRPLPAADALMAVDASVKEAFSECLHEDDEQRQTVHVLSLAHDAPTLHIVSPTGGGKTLTFLGPASAEAAAATAFALATAASAAAAAVCPGQSVSSQGVDSAVADSVSHQTLLWSNYAAGDGGRADHHIGPAVTIALTPTRAVTAKVLVASNELGVPVTVWRCGGGSTHNSTAASVVLDMCTAVQDIAAFLEFLSYLEGVCRLVRVVVNDLHLLPLWYTFCNNMMHVRLVLPQLSCPLNLLTATAPAAWLTTLLSFVGTPPQRPIFDHSSGVYPSGRSPILY